MRSDYRTIGAACFQMSSAEFEQVLPGWLHPLPLLDPSSAVPVINPYTGEPAGFSRRPQDEPLAVPGAIRQPDLRSLPWVDIEGLMPWDFQPLGACLLNWSDDDARDYMMGFLTGPEDTNDVLSVFPDELVRSVARLAEQDVGKVAERWSSLEGDVVTFDVATLVLERLRPFFSEALASEVACYLWSSR